MAISPKRLKRLHKSQKLHRILKDQENAVNGCLAKYPKDLQCRNSQANLALFQGNFDHAIALFLSLIDDNGSYGVRFDVGYLNYQLAYAFEGAGRAAEALKYFSLACQQNFASACGKLNQSD